MSTLSTHVLDTAVGRPVAGLHARLTSVDGEILGEGVTSADGRIDAIGPEQLEAGAYRLIFGTGAYGNDFYPEVVIVFSIADSDQHYHLPLLLSPYGYSTYRGS